MLIEDFKQTLDTWIMQLEKYSFAQLSAKPSPTSWSLGQVYMHLIESTNYYFGEIQICTTTSDDINEAASINARGMFNNNNFPDQTIDGPPSNADTTQPESKERLLGDLLQLKKALNETGVLIAKTQCKGKTKHLGLGYFNANEWLQFAEMHFRHHERQKKRLDDYIKTLTF